ncbi:uncharacterized protein PHALS_00322 [Plasmopara halstedii]|uniref:Uncharacterized protein n=1 Tax=Plasmopara halstedii TaxID=4781 RepID=A0A0P1A6J4_PLAHL|nr:uncharacterized protein PHALS_00322 [Plasmopara halstedii]CEG36000.1 hypothetical protein PHALS_00322 [Plasmopara halstedii]|eukprot:XP_024572369.1 hypothetical protein PHALS_00322 [Plasmopara halstedii]
MISKNDLNYGRKCMQDLDRFNESMGWTIKNRDGIDTEHHVSQPCQDFSRSAFGNIAKIPDDFVAPTNSSSMTRGQKSLFPSNRKRTGKFIADSNTEAQRIVESERIQQPPISSKKTRLRKIKLKSEPVDFVYDINVRRKLREQLDADRREVLHKANAREAMLRSKKMWIFDKPYKSSAMKSRRDN